MRGMPGDQAGPGVPVGRGVVRVRPVPSDLPAAHGHALGALAAARSCAVPTYRQRCTSARRAAATTPRDEALLDTRLIPDPARARVRVYATQSTHKTLTSLRQGSMIHVFDQDFGQKVEENFHEAYMAHTSTSPNYQILASLDLGRRQAALEGFELVQKQVEYAMRLRDADRQPPAAAQVHALPDHRRPDPARSSGRRGIDQPLRSGLKNMQPAWETGRVRARPVPGHDLHRRRPASTATRSSGST